MGRRRHRSHPTLEWVARQEWLSLEPLPGYAPDLNPTEQVWGSVKSTELAKLCLDTIVEVAAIAASGLNRVSNDTHLCLALLRHAGLRL